MGVGLVIGFDLKSPHSGSPRSTGWNGDYGMCCPSDSEFHIPPVHSSIAGHP